MAQRVSGRWKRSSRRTKVGKYALGGMLVSGMGEERVTRSGWGDASGDGR